jgi:hypothetical protein
VTYQTSKPGIEGANRVSSDGILATASAAGDAFQDLRMIVSRPARAMAMPRLLTAVGLLVLLAADQPRKPALALPPLNQKVLEFARGNLGKQVGNGECTVLAVEAFKHAGARRFRLLKDDGDYNWGRPVDSFREALPGDVLQFRDAVFEGKRWVTRTRWETWRHNYPHHTAIVAEVNEGGRLVTMLHQNIGPNGASDTEKKVVKETSLRPDSLQKGGKVWIYRPVGPDDADPPFDELPPCVAPAL